MSGDPYLLGYLARSSKYINPPLHTNGIEWPSMVIIPCLSPTWTDLSSTVLVYHSIYPDE